MTVSEQTPMQVEIWSDIACPWCYIGKRKFETALAGFEHRDDLDVTWRSFELDPDAPAERSGDLASHLASKYGLSVEEARSNQQRLSDLAQAEGLEFHFEAVRSGNTFDAHRLVHLAARHDLQDEAKERLLRAYFTEGELISDTETLTRLSVELGLPEAEISALLAGELYAAEVHEDEQFGQALGITGVPTFVVDRSIAVSGAQPPEVLLQLLETGWARRTSAASVADHAIAP